MMINQKVRKFFGAQFRLKAFETHTNMELFIYSSTIYPISEYKTSTFSTASSAVSFHFAFSLPPAFIIVNEFVHIQFNIVLHIFN